MGQQKRPTKRWAVILAEITDRLHGKYGSPWLGNFVDPVKEIFFIVLSARTSEALYIRAMNSLFEKFPDCSAIANANLEAVLDCVGGAGFGKKRSEQVIKIANRVILDLGNDPQSALREMSSTEVFQYLTSLPGVGPKSALCVMMWSLNIDVLPVDVNVQRIAARLGVIPVGLKHYQAQQKFPRYVPEGRSRDLHTAFMMHGREICKPIRPKCGECIVSDLCRMGREASKRHKQ